MKAGVDRLFALQLASICLIMPSASPLQLTSSSVWTPAMTSLSQYHAVLIEGMGSYDPRDPQLVANHVVEQLQSHWKNKDSCRQQQQQQQTSSKPKIVVIQGDPPSERGIAAISPRVATALDHAPRALVCLDRHMDPQHASNADRDGVVLEFRYPELRQLLNEVRPGSVEQLEEQVRQAIQQTNRQRRQQVDPQPPLKDYVYEYAMLQEVTKAACCEICGTDHVTVAHTSATIKESSVTSFYKVGLNWSWSLRQDQHMAPYLLDDLGKEFQ